MHKIDQRGLPWTNIGDWLDWSMHEAKLSPHNQEKLEHYYGSYKRQFPLYIKRHYVGQTKEVDDLLSTLNKARLLEVGCGCGTESLWFGLHGAQVLGIDLKQERLDVAKERLACLKAARWSELHVEFDLRSIFDIDDSDGFDVVWMEQAFHHIEPRSKLFRKLFNLTRSGGYIVISEANGLNPLTQLILLRRRGFRTVKTHTDQNGIEHEYGDERITTGYALRRALRKEGFTDVKIRHFRVLPNFASVDRWSWIDKMIPEWFVPAFTHCNVVARKP